MPGFRHRVEILRLEETGATDSENVPVRAWVTLASDVSALVQERTNAREVPVPERDGPALITGLIFLPWGTDVTEHDVIVLDGEEWNVWAARDGGGAGHHIEVDAERIRL